MVVALTLILLGYLLPHVVRTRQLLLESRVEDRFSGDLRIVATAGSPDTAQSRAEHARGHSSNARPYLHDPARRPEAPMNRPRARSERATEDARALAAARAARAARVSRRAAAARRRLILTVLLLAASAGAWTAVGVAGLSWALAVVPTLLLVTVLVLGRRTAVRVAELNRRDRAEMARLEARLKAVSRRAQATPPRRSTSGATSARGTGTAGRAAVSRGATTRDAAAAAASASGAAVEHDDARIADAESSSAVVADAPVADAPDAEVRGDAAPVQAGEVVQPQAAEPVWQAPPAGPGEDDVEAPVLQADVARGGTSVAVAEDIVEAEVVEDEAPVNHGAEESTPDDRPWTPVPVPAPSYTLKQEAPRRDVAPFAQEAAPTAAVPQRPTVASPASAPAPAVEEPVAITLDLDAVLARRRAAGE
ncbi:hypothetical protein ATJ97_1391 [Georgenia soli]|uniref:Uncharacterized protein n=1 Tax=Georgenia soli TaxID=638953 RepID=A0A2A9EKY0_9MICO|nr:hypothetical protein ATJ97_1391 [Georgenia soli]